MHTKCTVGGPSAWVMAMVASFLWAVTAHAQSDKSDFDLVCAITTGAQMNQDEQRAAATMPAHSLLYRPVKCPRRPYKLDDSCCKPSCREAMGGTVTPIIS